MNRENSTTWACLWVFACALSWGPAGQAASRVESALSPQALIGIPMEIKLTVTPELGVGVYAVEDEVPAGWTVSQVSHNGRFDPVNRKVKWGPYFDPTGRVLSYLVTPTAVGEATFAGVGSFDGIAITILGQRQTTVLPTGEASKVESLLPMNFVPGQPVGVTLEAKPALNISVYSVEDQVPVNWTIGTISPGGVFDAANRKVKWGPFFDSGARTFSYQMTSPLGAGGTFTLNGVGSFDGVAVAVTGKRTTIALASTVVSTLPEYYQPGILLTLSLAVSSLANVSVYAVEDQIPHGWAVSEITEGGVFDAPNRTVKFGPYFDQTPRTLSCQLTPPANASGTAIFTGRGSFDGNTILIAGRREVKTVTSTIASALPAEFLPDIPLAVSLTVTPDGRVQVYAVEDRVPVDWIVSGITENGTFDAAHRTIKWGPFFDPLARVLSYQATPPRTATGRAAFNGVGAFDGVTVVITGARESTAVEFGAVNRVVRQMPLIQRAGRSSVVSCAANAGTNVRVYAVEDQVPAGWTVGNISHGGSFDAVNHKVKWGPFFDPDPRVLTYEASSPQGTSSGEGEFVGSGSFDGVRVAIGGPSRMQVVGNHEPVARPDTLQRAPGQELMVAVANLLGNDSDADQDVLTLTQLAAVTPNGATVSLTGNEVKYQPPSGFNGTDSFTYTVSDGNGGAATGTVTVEVVASGPGQNIKAIVPQVGGAVLIRFGGLPGRTYRIEATDSLNPPVWVQLGTRVAAANGEFEFLDADAPNHPTRFYRSATP